MGGGEAYAGIWWRQMKKIDNLGDLGADGW